MKNALVAVCGSAAMMLAMTATAQIAPAVPSAPGTVAQQAPPADPFPPMNPKFFTATTPSLDTVNAFLQQMWGYEPNRIFRVVAIQKTAAPDISKVTVLVADKTKAGTTQSTTFYVTPDGKHALAMDSVLPFGATPFAENRKMLMERANGPARGVAAKDVLIVEFTDLQCPHCKEAQPIIDQIATDFPSARVVVEPFPLTDIHPYAFQAAAEGVCVRKAKGDEAYFKYAQAVFDTQGALTPESAQATLDAAVAKTGSDPAAAAACAKTPAATEAVNASMKLAQDLGVESTPTLFVNGQSIQLGGLPYEYLKKIIAYRATQDGVPTRVQPSLKTLK